ncbi:POP3 [[Candida] subhashii]|uniref:POP3 n=1 Tax=[Candida] subhashii TaxID=561895 RepID=A0A8J5QNX4_9ASCO|nr:POP3 [[Candida] subhashii]KAG7663855.1 POP3 [[Candida] subhashii]
MATGSNKGNKKAPKASSLKEIEKKKKIIFKPILDNPYTQSNLWPFIEPSIGSNILQLLEVLLSPIGKYNSLDKDNKSKINPPDIINEVKYGFNSIVEQLELQAKHFRGILINKNIEQKKVIKYLFVCKYDITPTLLTSMFPVLSYTSSKDGQNRVKLIQLPRGSMEKLSLALNVSNTGIIGITECELREAKPLFDLININVKDVEVPWLQGLFDPEANPQFAAPALRHISISAPVGPQRKTQKQKQKIAKDSKQPKEMTSDQQLQQQQQQQQQQQ